MMDPIDRQIAQKEAFGYLLGVVNELESGLAGDERILRRTVKASIHNLTTEVRPRIEKVLDSLIMETGIDDDELEEKGD